MDWNALASSAVSYAWNPSCHRRHDPAAALANAWALLRADPDQQRRCRELHVRQISQVVAPPAPSQSSEMLLRSRWRNRSGDPS